MIKSRVLAVLAAVAILSGCATSAPRTAQTPAAAPQQSSAAKRIVKDGVAVELSMGAVKDNDVEVRFQITNADNGAPITGLNPIAWIDRYTTTPTDDSCKAKIKSFLGGSLQARPEADLNTYSVVTLNRDATVSVIDPLLGFGGSKLLALVMLGGEGADWALTPDQRTLFVSVPVLNEVVAIDTQTWKIATRIAVGQKPQRIALQPDAGYLWVATAEGVSVIDAAERRAIANVTVGAGEHEFAFSRDSRYAFVSNKGGASVSVVDVRDPKQVRTVATAASPVALTYSALSNAVYVGHEDGTIVVIDAAGHEVRNRVATTAGLRTIGFSPDGRWGFVLNTADDTVKVLDSSTDRIVQSITVAGDPDKVSFTDLYAYVRAAGSEEVSMIRLSTVEEGKEPAISRFPSGQTAPEYASGPALPAAIVPAPEQGAVLVSNPADKMIYYYSEGMAAPMGSFQNYRREPLGVLAVSRNLRETQPGVYSTTVRLAKGGRFDVPFLLDSPKMTQCFDYSVELLSDAKATEETASVKIERLFETSAGAGSPFNVRVRVTDGKSGKPLNDVKDLRVLTFTPALHQTRTFARAVGDGVYEAIVTPADEGVYYVFFEASSLGKTYRQLPHWVVTATKKGSHS
ncbi:MAG TPA: YncE family protein [Thermoanaerobaculia bacterium]|nr:YncE family protein [Thermoanaerobaculia bacterium]